VPRSNGRTQRRTRGVRRKQKRLAVKAAGRGFGRSERRGR